MDAKGRDEKKRLIEKAGMMLTDEELNQVAGGGEENTDSNSCPPHDFGPDGGLVYCRKCRMPKKYSPAKKINGGFLPFL